LARQLSALQDRLSEAEDTLNAIRSGAVDALVVQTPRGEQLFTLKGADQTYRALVEAMNEGAVTLNNGIISYCNNHFAEMVGIPMEEVFGASFFDLVESDDVSRLIRRLHTGLQPQGTIEASLSAADRRQVPVSLSFARFRSDGQVTLGVVVTDITERKEVERARHELSRRIINAMEQERHRVARDLHDSVSQMLASAKYRLNNIAFVGLDEARRRDFRHVRDLIENAIGEVRVISRNLRPSELDDLGLVAALRSLAHEFQERCGIATKFKNGTPAPPRMHAEMEMTLYRIAQEALNNVEKHSQATRAEVAFGCTQLHALLTVRDNGKGFRRQTASDGRSGWGLENMNERARLLDGTIEVASLAKTGTRITVRIPLGNQSKSMARPTA
jgi:PAS domain S-box-containing protein